MGKEAFIELAEIFQDNMVLQRNKPLKLWGTAKKKQSLSVMLDGTEIFRGEIAAGRFELSLPPQEAAENRTLSITNREGETVRLRNIDIGEVWIAGGQSNMEFPLLCDRDAERVIQNASDTHLRYYEVGKYAFEGEKEEKLKDDHRWNHWRKFIPEECTHFSAVGTYYAMQLRARLQVPVAIVGCCWGGTSAAAWMKEDILRKDDRLQVYTTAYDQAVSGQNMEKYLRMDRKNRAFLGKEKNTIGAEKTMKNEVTAPLKFPMKQLVKLMLKNQKTGPHDANRPGGLYQTMLSKIIGFPVKGVIWYQGEADEKYASLYDRLFTEMIRCWREDWREELPLLFVQLAPWGEWMAQDGRNFPQIRSRQQYVEDHVKGTYMVSIMDEGSQYDIHPKVKEPVGNRLALLALDEIYGIKQKYCRAPRITKAERTEKGIILSFDYAEGGLKSEGSIDALFSVVQNGKELPVFARITGSQVELGCRELTKEKATVAFAYRPFLKVNLFNQGGLPARPYSPQEV